MYGKREQCRLFYFFFFCSVWLLRNFLKCEQSFELFSDFRNLYINACNISDGNITSLLPVWFVC
jgi:hypothetical protein